MQTLLNNDVISVQTRFHNTLNESTTAALGRAARLEAGGMQEGQGVTEAKIEYGFGDYGRGLLASGRLLRGGTVQDDSYKFGDFTRGVVHKFYGSEDDVVSVECERVSAACEC